VGYSWVFKQLNLKDYILYAPRTDFISANKEGIFSLPCYVAITLVGIGVG
jgi:phosphatidylinositol glycan class W